MTPCTCALGGPNVGPCPVHYVAKTTNCTGCGLATLGPPITPPIYCARCWARMAAPTPDPRDAEIANIRAALAAVTVSPAELDAMREECDAIGKAPRRHVETDPRDAEMIALTEMLATRRDEVERLRAEVAGLRVGRLAIVGHVLEQIDEATQLGGVTASRLAEMLGYRVGELYLHRIQNVANTTFEAGTEFVEACLALGVEENIGKAIERIRAAAIRACTDVGCVGDDEMGCTRDDGPKPRAEWCAMCLLGDALGKGAGE